jgi:hypothetical protein
MSTAPAPQPQRALEDAIAEQGARLELLIDLERGAVAADERAAEQLRARVRRLCGDLLFAARVEPPCACALCRK